MRIPSGFKAVAPRVKSAPQPAKPARFPAQTAATAQTATLEAIVLIINVDLALPTAMHFISQQYNVI